jgi:cytoskeletal protein RodZ
MRPEKPSSARLNWPILIEILEPGATPTNLSEPSDGTLQSSLAATAALGITPYGMFLAGILGTCMLLCIPAFGVARSVGHFPLPGSQSSSPSSSPPSASGQQTSTTEASPSSSTAKPKSSSEAKPPKKKKKVAGSTAPDQSPKKKVVSRGGTDEPTTQISPSMTEEQAANSRATTTNLITQTDENLSKLSARQLSADEQETVDQIRKFVEQSKVADHEGDLPRAASLANKAKLLSDALVKP